MRKDYIAVLLGICASFPALASNEGVPSYYQTSATSMNRAAYANYQNNGYINYGGTSGSKQVVASNSYTYTVPRAQPLPEYAGTPTTNGIAQPAYADNGVYVYGGYSRRFADFQFKTSVNSILEWDDMIFNELTVGARYNFSLRNFDLTAFGEYTYGNMESGGLSMDYDLLPYDKSDPHNGVFTVSVGDQSGENHHMRFGLGAHNIWDIGGWKLTPIIGYEIFKHNLQMSDHYFPNEGVYIPLMTTDGDYVFGNTQTGIYYSIPIDQAEAYADTDYYYQVCVSPEQIQLANINSAGGVDFSNYTYTDPDSTVPWGVTFDECVIIGGDGPILVSGKTHEYNTTWSGFYIGLEVEKQMTLTDKLRLYGQVSMPKYSSEGIWPNRTDWQQHPSFLDEGDSGAFAYAFEMEYILKLSDRLQLSLKADTNYFHIGKIGGKIYWAPYTEYVLASDEDLAYIQYPEGVQVIAIEHPAETERVTDALKEATWQSFSLHLGVKYAF